MKTESVSLQSGWFFTLVRSTRRTMALEVREDGRVVVRAPLFTPTEAAKRFFIDHLPWIEKQQKRIEACPKRREPTPAEVAALRALLDRRLPEYAALLGVVYRSLRITSAKKRWGSCTPKTGSICFSKYLALCPTPAAEYVMVHELAHLRYPNHSNAFHDLIKQILPDAENRKKMLRVPQTGEKTG